MRRWKKALLPAVVIFLMTGCGKSTAEVTTIAIQKDGSIEHTMIETFEEDSVDTLQDMMLTEVADYNKTISGDGIAVKKVEEHDGTVKVVMTYPSASDFDGFMNAGVLDVDPSLRAPFFYGTVQEAFSEGYDMNITLHGVENENILQGREDILLVGENKIIIYDSRINLGEQTLITSPEPLLYISDNVNPAGKKAAEVSDTDQLAYILLEG